MTSEASNGSPLAPSGDTAPAVDRASLRGVTEVPEFVAFVLGATGYVGREVVRQLSERPGVVRVLAHVRPGSMREGLARSAFGEHDRVHIEQCEPTAEALTGAFLSGAPTHVFLCHGTTAKHARAEGIDDPYERVDFELARRSYEAALALETAPRIVLLSSVGANPRSRNAYLRARGRAEESLRGSGIPFTICRAPLINGPDRDEHRPLEVFARRTMGPLLRLAGWLGLRKLSARHLPMDGAEVAEGLIRSGFHYMTIGRLVRSDELRRVGVYERETWTPASRRDTDRH